MKEHDLNVPVNLKREDDDYFKHAFDYLKKQEGSNRTFWLGLGGKPPLKGAKVLEVGCGFGSLCIDIALSGAEKVIGIDTNSRDIEFANNHLRQKYKNLTNVVEFIDIDLRNYSEFNFDYIVSKNAFEHVINLEEMLSEIKRRLQPGGRLYAGFGPLWNSPFGLHGNVNGWNFKNKNPWGHLLIRENQLLEIFNHFLTNKVGSISELGLNQMSLADYRRIFHDSEFSINYFKTNNHKNYKSKIFNLFSKLSLIEEYFTNNIYCILEK